MPVLVLFFASVLWGLTWIPLKYLHNQGLSGVSLIAVSYGTVAIISLPILLRQRRQWIPSGAPLLAILLLGGIAILSFNYSLMYGDVVRVMVLFYLLPVWSALGGRLVLGEALDGQRCTSVFLALLGAFLILGGWHIFSSPFQLIDALALLAGFAFALNNLVFRATPHLPLASKLGALFWGSSLLASAFLLSDAEQLANSNPKDWLLMAAMGLGWYLLVNVGSQWGVTQLEAGQAGVIMVMELIAAVVSSAYLGESQLTAINLAGVGCVLVASILEAWRPAKPMHQVPRSLSRNH